MAVLLSKRDRIPQLFVVLVIIQLGIFVAALGWAFKLPAPAPENIALSSIPGPVELTEPSPDTESDRVISYKVQRGDTLASIWVKNGAPYSGALRAAEAFKQAGISTGSLRAGEEMQLSLSTSGDIVNLERKLDGGRTFTMKGDSVAGYEVNVISGEIVEKEQVATGTILSSFSETALEGSVPYAIIDEFVDLFGSRVEFSRNLQPGDTFTITYKERRVKDSNELVGVGAIESASLKTAGDMLVALRHVGKNNEGHYYDESGEPLGNYFLRYPLKFTRISSSFSYARFHPVLQVKRPHLGVDFAAPTGTPVRAVADGVITDAGYRGGSGNLVRIEHSSRYDTAYLHLSNISSGLRAGTRVKRGQVIGKVGMTGLATGPHLHFSLYDRGVYVDPLSAKLPNLTHGIEPIPQGILLAALRSLKREHEVLAMAAIASADARS